MRVRGNWISLFSWRAYSTATGQVDRSVARLSSGKRINAANDDAAGLGISQRIIGQFRGLMQANRNALDGISLVQTAESTLQEVHTLLQRGRELALQAANDTLSEDDRGALQYELEQLLQEIDRIADSAQFNGQQLFGDGNLGAVKAKVITGLRTGWFTKAEEIISQQYGLSGDGTKIRIAFEQTGSEAAWISGTANPGDKGHLDNLTLHINLQSFAAGDVGPIFNDRKVARALTLAVLARNSDYTKVDAWFRSGVADYIAGGDEELKAAIESLGGDAQAVTEALADPDNWVDDGVHRAAAYLAVKYLHYWLMPGRTMEGVFAYLQDNTLEDTLSFAYGSVSTETFIADFTNALWGGADYLNTQLDLTDADVGGIGGGDAITVIPDDATYNTDPLAGFEIDWPPVSGGKEFTLQIGANVGNTLTFSIEEVSTYTLDLLGIDIVKKPMQGLGQLSKAIQTVTSVRAKLGSVSNRLEHTITANTVAAEAGQSSNSRIVDLDMANEVASLTRSQIMVSSSTALLAQANTMRQHVNWLLKGVVTTGPSAPALGAM